MFTFSASQGICRVKLENRSTNRCKKIHAQRDDINQRTTFSLVQVIIMVCDSKNITFLRGKLLMAPPCRTLTLSCHLVSDTLSPTCHTLSPTCHTLSHQVTQDRLTNTNLGRHPHVTLGVGCVTAGAPRKQSKLVLTPCGRTFLHRKDGCLKMGFYLSKHLKGQL